MAEVVCRNPVEVISALRNMGLSNDDIEAMGKRFGEGKETEIDRLYLERARKKEVGDGKNGLSERI